jgi:heme/copper-type cytochrome/quinol oxidase subunit 4
MEHSSRQTGEDEQAAGAAAHRASARTAGATLVVLVVATIAAWLLATFDRPTGAEAFTLKVGGILVLAFLKIYLVLSIFMGLGRGPAGWHAAAAAWIFVLGGLIFLLVARS